MHTFGLFEQSFKGQCESVPAPRAVVAGIIDCGVKLFQDLRGENAVLESVLKIEGNRVVHHFCI